MEIVFHIALFKLILFGVFIVSTNICLLLPYTQNPPICPLKVETLIKNKNYNAEKEAAFCAKRQPEASNI